MNREAKSIFAGLLGTSVLVVIQLLGVNERDPSLDIALLSAVSSIPLLAFFLMMDREPLTGAYADFCRLAAMILPCVAVGACIRHLSDEAFGVFLVAIIFTLLNFEAQKATNAKRARSK